MNIVGSITVQVKYDSFKVIYTSLKVQYATNIYISKYVESCLADQISFIGPSSYYHFFSIAIVSSKNRVFFLNDLKGFLCI